MKFGTKAKKYIGISSCLILLVAIVIWYLFPVLMFKLFWYQNELLRSYLEVLPVSVEKLNDAPNDWQEISIGDFSFKLPGEKYTTRSGRELPFICFLSDRGNLCFFLENQNIRHVSYQERIKILNTTPSDVSFFNPRERNVEAFENLVLKAVSIPNGGLRKAIKVETRDLVALCILSEKREKGYSAITNFFRPSEELKISLILKNYKDTITLENDLYAMLGGITIPDDMNDSDRINQDIETIINQFNQM